MMAFLHIIDKGTEVQLKDDKDKLLKVRPLYDHINTCCQKYCQPDMEISIDEKMKAHFSFKQYIRNKPTKWGFKLWCLCNAEDGYTVKFSIYRGKTGEVSSKKGLSCDVVLHLMSGYLNQGYSLFVDNFYTSPTLASDLFAQKTHVTGTLDRTRKGIPPEVIESFCKNQTSCMYVRDDCTVYSVWKDTKCLSVLSTKYPGYSEKTVKCNTKDADGHHEKSDVPIPSPIYRYNKYMSGVDKSDQLINYYNVLRISKKYWKTLFFHFVDISIVNSYIIHTAKEKKPMKHYEFRERLVRGFSGFSTSSCTREAESAGKESTSNQCSLLEHQPVPLQERSPCVYCKLTQGKTHYTTRQCKQCKSSLCFRDRNCFVQWHDSSFRVSREEWLRGVVMTDLPTQQKPGRPVGSAVTKGREKRKKKRW